MSEIKPLCSIIVPAYNHADYIEECLKSILKQDYDNFEIIVVDDASTDDTPKIIEEIALSNSKVRFIKNERNIGLTRTLNKALKNYVSGKYTIQIASDDVFCEGRIRKQVDFMENFPQYAMAYSNAFMIDENSCLIDVVEPKGKSGWIFDELFLARFNIPAYTCIYRTNIFHEVGYYDEESLIEDSDIWYKITKKYQVGFIDMFSAYYRRHSFNTSKRYLDMYNDTLRRLKKYESEPNYSLALKRTHVRGFFYISLINKKKALKLMPKAFTAISSKFFWGGLLNIVGLGTLLKKYVK